MIELTEGYVPTEFLHRQNQIDTIRKIFSQFKVNSYAGNLILLGTTGAGKTSTLKKVCMEEDNHIYINAAENNTTHKIFKAITKKTCHSNSEQLNSLIEEFKKNPKILVIDEAGKIGDTERFCDFLNAFYRRAQSPIILATNKWTFVEEMPDDARLTLFLERVEFPCYDAHQIADILNNRLNLIKDKINFQVSGPSIQYISGKVVKEHLSSVRIALSVLSKCVSNHDDSLEFIDKQLEQIHEQDWRNFIHKLTETEKEFLNVILDLAETRLELPISNICEKMHRVGPSRISQLATTFIDYGILNAKYKNLGRGGGKFRVLTFSRPEYRTKLLKLLSPWEVFEEPIANR